MKLKLYNSQIEKKTYEYEIKIYIEIQQNNLGFIDGFH